MISLFYGQDQWTTGRLTLQGSRVRYDNAFSWAPVEHNGIGGPSRWNAAAAPIQGAALGIPGDRLDDMVNFAGRHHAALSERRV